MKFGCTFAIFILMFARLARADVEWLDSLDAGYMRSQVNGRPMLVFIGSDRVQMSRELWEVLHTSDWTKQLETWTTVQLSSDAVSPAVRSLGVVGAPAVRLLAADGRLLAGHDGFVSVEEFSSWWQEHSLVKANVGSPESFSVPQVVELLGTGSLSQRLSAIDLLEQWQAPCKGIDPWQPSTFTSQRRVVLEAWVKSHATTKPASAAVGSVEDELDALLLATTEIQARAVRQRLAGFGPSILPQVYERLKQNPHEPGRHRLVALRYRLVATDALAAQWPGGFDRLASSDPLIRRAAVSDLASHAKPEDHRLLSELFADDDPFVRAQSLKLLSSLGGPESRGELIALLGDPEPNVRAAVLDTFAETPNAAVVSDLVKYAATETNTDLVVHVVHVLEATPGDDSFNALIELLKHPQWRVRGEAAEAFTGKLSNLGSGDNQTDEKDTATAALVKLLGDPDGYVVSRAAGTLIKATFETSARALMKRVPNRPDLAVDVLKAVAANEKRQFVPQIRRLTASTQPAIRASAVAALAALVPNDCGEAMAIAVRDPEVRVREAGFHGVQAALGSLIPADASPPPQADDSVAVSTGAKLPSPQSIAVFCGGKGRPKWLNDLQPDLEKGLKEDACRVPAATILCALGKDGEAMPVLLNVQRGEANDAAMALVWLPWDEKYALYKSLLAQVGVDKSGKVIEQFATVNDPRIKEELWKLLGPGAKPEYLEPVHQVLQQMYLGSNYYNAENLPDEQKQPIIDALMDRVHSGVALQRSSALAMLVAVSPRKAVMAAKDVYADPHATEWERIDALQVQLGVQSGKTADKLAVAAMDDPAMRKIAIAYLAGGSSEISRLRGEIYLYFRNSYNATDGQPIFVVVPEGLDTPANRDALRQLMKGDDADLAGYAGYLLGLLGDRGALDVLVSSWRSHDQDESWSRLVYRVIAKNNLDDQVPVLTEIYQRFRKRGNYYVPEMYWTLKTMAGVNTKNLLDKMKDTPGVSSNRLEEVP